LTVSTPVKLFALVAALAALLLVGGMTMLGPSADDAAFAEPILVPKKRAALAPDVEPTAAKQSAAKPAARQARPQPSAPAKPRPKKRVPLVAPNGLPMSIMTALARRPVVVVSLVDGGAKVDPLARAEAEAGARGAGAAFVAIDVTREQKAAHALLLKFGGALRSPAVYVFTRPGEVAVALDGFRDRDTIAQAALNARR